MRTRPAMHRRFPLPCAAVVMALAGVGAGPAHASDSGGLQAGDGEAAKPAPEGRDGAKLDAPREKASPPKAKGKRRSPRSRDAGRPVLSAFSARPSRLFLYGTPATVAFRISDKSRTVKVRLDVLGTGGRVLRRIDLGSRPTGSVQSYRLTGREGGHLPQGALELRIAARDPSGRSLKRTAKASGVDRLGFYWHHFPVAGNFGFGGDGSRFGSARPGHVHQGQDIPTPEGTPLLAPRGGRVRIVANQPGGAGQYVILTGAGERREYAFFHLQAGSIRVRPGQTVRTGERMGSTGNTGSSSGAHLHFEVWEGGPWQGGGRPVDPLPYLRNWDGWS
ncbi:MAG: M23 family metallopeptidase [Thermoleophilaceae bacterium]